MKATHYCRVRFPVWLTCVVVALLSVAIAMPAAARFAPPQAVPVDRIIANMTKKLEEAPNCCTRWGGFTISRTYSRAGPCRGLDRRMISNPLQTGGCTATAIS